MSNSMTVIDNQIESGDWCIILFNGEVVHEGHSYPTGYDFVHFFEVYNGTVDRVNHVQMTDAEIVRWQEVLYGGE